MLNEKEKNSTDLQNAKPKVKLMELKTLQDLTPLGSDNSAGFVCDIDTGICGPIAQEKEEEK